MNESTKAKRMIMVPRAVIRRLPMYHRFLNQLVQLKVERISSKELSKLMGITSSQLRQDLNYFGEFGQQGYGYNVELLDKAISGILGMEKKYDAVLVGAGNIGKAIAAYPGFSRRGLNIIAIFDIKTELIGERIENIPVYNIEKLSDFLNKNQVEIGIIAIPAENAQNIADIFVKKGIKGIWNFAPIFLKEAEGVVIEDIHLGDSLLTLFYKMKEV